MDNQFEVIDARIDATDLAAMWGREDASNGDAIQKPMNFCLGTDNYPAYASGCEAGSLFLWVPTENAGQESAKLGDWDMLITGCSWFAWEWLGQWRTGKGEASTPEEAKRAAVEFVLGAIGESTNEQRN